MQGQLSRIIQSLDLDITTLPNFLPGKDHKPTCHACFKDQQSSGTEDACAAQAAVKGSLAGESGMIALNACCQGNGIPGQLLHVS